MVCRKYNKHFQAKRKGYVWHRGSSLGSLGIPTLYSIRPDSLQSTWIIHSFCCQALCQSIWSRSLLFSANGTNKALRVQGTTPLGRSDINWNCLFCLNCSRSTNRCTYTRDKNSLGIYYECYYFHMRVSIFFKKNICAGLRSFFHLV